MGHLADMVLSMVWAFPANDSRRVSVRELAADIDALYDQLATVTAQRDALHVTLASRVDQAVSQALRSRLDEMGAALRAAEGILASWSATLRASDNADPEMAAALCAVRAALEGKS